ncbi:MAG: MBL fold metallo-hydrolase [Clostridiaceae bacterium]|nr:MBL fold metallo-hydrolase [Clostridiaceae bacterium]
MKLNLLGSGGVAPPPRPCCNCKVCTEARQKGIPFLRTGPSLYVYDAGLLFDTPDEIRIQLNRENIDKVENIILTHWHPDHTQGLRVMEQINFNHLTRMPKGRPINVFIAPKQLVMMKNYGSGNILLYLESKKIIKILPIEHREIIELGDIKVLPLYIPKTQGYYFMIVENRSKVVYAPCEYHEFKLYEEVKNIDIFIPHHLYFEDKTIGTGADYSDTEDSFEMMLEHSGQMNAKRIIVTHIDESFGLSHIELNDLCKTRFRDYPIEFGYDGQIIEL